MRLASVYIPENSLPHIFGENHNGQTLNLGGEYFYSFTETSEEISIESKTKNELFIPNFHHEDISLISTIVGQNGAGKSTLLRGFNHSIDPSSKNFVYLFEPESSTIIEIFNDTTKRLLCPDHIENTTLDRKPFEVLYYSPNLDYDLVDTKSPITLINYLNDGLENYFLDSVSRNVSFLNDEIIQSIKNVYHDFPSYDFIKVNTKRYRKSFFRVPYLETNFGTPHRGDALRNEIKGELSRFENETYGRESYTREEIIKMMEGNVKFLESESFTEMFTKLWNIEEYKFTDDSGYEYVHSSDNLIKNIEITILSYLLLGATFPQTGLGGGISFNKIIEANSFKERLDLFLELYLVNEEEFLTDTIKKVAPIDVSTVEHIIETIKDYSIVKSKGTDLAPIKERMISDAQGFGDIYIFYCKLINFCNNDNVVFDQENLIFDIRKNETKLLFDELIFSYKYVLKSFPKSPVTISLLNFIPNKKLSTGEKAILDFYSSIYHYIDINNKSLHLNYEYFLLLLDEPDLGFHPLWKKKFIEAISSTLPILFSKMTPHVYDNAQKDYIKIRENPIIQILFTTHDSLTLSDMPNNSVVYVKKENQHSRILENNDPQRPQKTFGANITNLLADSFFVEDGLIGGFAKNKIEITLNWLKINANKFNRLEKEGSFFYDIDASIDILNFEKREDEVEYHRKIIELIDEPLVKNKLMEMFIEYVTDDNIFLKSELEKAKEKVSELEKRINR